MIRQKPTFNQYPRPPDAAKQKDIIFWHSLPLPTVKDAGFEAFLNCFRIAFTLFTRARNIRSLRARFWIKNLRAVYFFILWETVQMDGYTQRNGLRVQNFSAAQKILPLLRANRGRFFCIEALIDASCHKHIRRICANFLLQRQRDRQIDVFLADSVRG